MRTPRYLAISAALLMTLSACSKKNNDTSEAPEPETAQTTESVTPALDPPLTTFGSADFRTISVNVSVIDQPAPLDMQVYTVPELEAGDRLTNTELVFTGSSIFRSLSYGEQIVDYIDIDGEVLPCYSGYTVDTIAVERIEPETGDVTQFCTIGEVHIPVNTTNAVPYTEDAQGRLYIGIVHSAGDHNDTQIWRLAQGCTEPEILAETDAAVHASNGRIYADAEDGWLVFDEETEEFVTADGSTDVSGTFTRPDGKGGYTISTPFYTINTSLRTGSLISAAEDRAMIYLPSTMTLHTFDIATREHYTSELAELGNYVLPCGNGLLTYYDFAAPGACWFEPSTGAAFAVDLNSAFAIDEHISGGTVNGVSYLCSDDKICVFTPQE